MEEIARGILQFGAELVEAGRPESAIEMYAAAIESCEAYICPDTVAWLRLHRLWCYHKAMGERPPHTTSSPF